MNRYVVLRVVTKLMIPIILIYALYVQFHGEYGPGGGFQAGVIFTSAFVVYSIIYGLEAAQRAVPPRTLHVLSALGVLMFVAFGIAGMVLGGNFLEYKVLLDNNHAAETLGIIGIELAVGIVVASVSLSLFYSFAGRTRVRRS